jgi:hypothetical protein
MKQFRPSFTNVHNKLEYLALASFSSLVQCLRVSPDPILVEHHSGTPLLGRLLALSANIRLGWHGLSGTNILAHC